MPQVDPRLFIHCTDADGVLLVAISASPHKSPVSLSRFEISHLVDGHSARIPAYLPTAAPRKEFYRRQPVAARDRICSIRSDLERLCRFPMNQLDT
jgi:hypothetical protein